ncbi:hypothetical protein GCM10008107_11360 [Psychrosphaera saromensis]|uniref:Uncharacterized protein n=1 Tax=Psychrosphaera saromensis TaxID=716813 RepID=A0A2S7UV23_9GAMM|nr:hypothetical protein [Psychrosphaera saromensis]PQJ53599.1 hypothetical protein BTO11_07910 [Psychrosphaera saromensis]GHB63959.1 hypothetical protein GCM10008107_11360 [Psychrosphaera saromensis]GLQ15639.1 hypothetical protein GCM10007917_30940 [Psychrosphaera saromensis]
MKTIPLSTVNSGVSQLNTSSVKFTPSTSNSDDEVVARRETANKAWEETKASPQIQDSTEHYKELLAIEGERLFSLPSRRTDSYQQMEKGAKEVIAQISLEHPEILAKDFDFTRTMDGVEVVEHNLTESEYNYVKYVANNNRNLVDGSDNYNQVFAEAKTIQWQTVNGTGLRVDEAKPYIKEDVAGNINILSFMDDVLDFMWDEGSPIDSRKDDIFKQSYQYRADFSTRYELLNSVAVLKNIDEMV